MKIFCEIMFSDILPALRALIAKELLNNYGITQAEVSKKLGVSQSTVSQYKNDLRGSKTNLLISNKNIVKLTKNIASDIASDNAKFYERVFEVCREVRKSRTFSGKLCSKCLREA